MPDANAAGKGSSPTGVLGGRGGRDDCRELLCDNVVGVEEKLNRKSSKLVPLSNAGVDADICLPDTLGRGDLFVRRNPLGPAMA